MRVGLTRRSKLRPLLPGCPSRCGDWVLVTGVETFGLEDSGPGAPLKSCGKEIRVAEVNCTPADGTNGSGEGRTLRKSDDDDSVH